MEIVTPRLLLRDFTVADASAFAAYQEDPRAREFHEPGDGPPAPALAERFAAWARESPRRSWQLAIARRDEPDALVGTCGLRTHDLPPGVAEFGVELAPAWWRQGYAHEAARALLAWGFRELGLAEVRADTVGGNARVARLLDRLGFTAVRTRPGTPWMAARGWHHVEWRLARASSAATHADDAGVEHARIYDALFVPAEFARWAPRVADAARLAEGERVLDVACGTGALTREAAARVGARGRVVGLDLDAGMLAVAAERSPAVEWRQGTAERLPFADATFDAVLCQFGLMFVPDRTAAVREMLRVLVDGGRLVAAVWDRVEHTPAYAVLIDAVERVAGAGAAAALREPFSLGDRATLETLVVQAGAQAVQVATVSGTSDFPSVRALVEAELRGWLPVAGIALDAEQAEAIVMETERRLAHHRDADGRLRFPSPAHVLTARR